MNTQPYIVFARKYRPRNFEEVIGQEAVTTTLKNAITLGRVGHAYLFAGPRGVGKTSLARIFAKALNCQSGPTPKPCSQCRACLEIEEGRFLDVLEIDGASNRGIDEIRSLRENVKFAPASGRFKIYIIDEVHQITTDGFNALLKTLEEPPAHVKFLLATTAPHKVPATILSRCQRFDLRRISNEHIVEVLKEICRREKIQIDPSALEVIAKAADGSLRDGQSLLDQIAACAEGKVSSKEVYQSLGSLEEETLVRLTDALAKRDAKGALLLLHGLLEQGKDPFLLLEKLLEHVRHLLCVLVSPELLDLVNGTESYQKELLRQRELFTREDLFYFFSVMAHTLQTLKRFEAKRIPLEIAILKLTQRVPLESLSEILEALKSQEKKVGIPGLDPQGDSEGDRESEEWMDQVEEDRGILHRPTEEKKPESLQSVWQLLIGALKNEKISVATYLAEGEPQDFREGVATISFPERFNFHRESLETEENRTLIEKHLSALMNQKVRVVFESVKELNQKNKVVKSAMNLFGGRMLTD